MKMEATPVLQPHDSADWGVRFLCDCKKDNKEIRIHHGFAHDISTNGLHILSEHNICPQKKIAIQLMIPSQTKFAPQKIVKIIGHTVESISQDDKYLTKIAVQHFEEDGLRELEKSLRQRFEQQFSTQTALRA
jgi:hypothetical protein